MIRRDDLGLCFNESVGAASSKLEHERLRVTEVLGSREKGVCAADSLVPTLVYC